MFNLTLIGTENWLGLLTSILIAFCLYFSLSFFQHLKLGDERLIRQSKLAASYCLALALFIPALYSLYISMQ